MVQERWAPFRQQITLFTSIAAAAARVQATNEWWPCGRGCSECCRHAFAIAENEWRLMQIGFAALDKPTQDAIRQRARRAIKQMRGASGRAINWNDAKTRKRLGFDLDLPCPFLDAAGACQVYDVRPSICRMFGYGGFRQTDRRGAESVQSYICSIIGRELDTRRAAGQEVELADLTEHRHELLRIELGERRSIAEWIAEG